MVKVEISGLTINEANSLFAKLHNARIRSQRVCTSGDYRIDNLKNCLFKMVIRISKKQEVEFRYLMAKRVN